MDFVSFARSVGVEISNLVQGKIQRCPTTSHPRSSNGAYFYQDGRGWAMDWSQGDKPSWWNDPGRKPFSEQDKADWARKRREAEQQREKLSREAIMRARKLLEDSEIKEHQYLVEKGFKEEKCFVNEDSMLVPMRSLKGDLVGVQTISLVDSRWKKKMIYGMQAKGAVYQIGRKNPGEMWLVEGYATALSVNLALKFLNLNAGVLVCFSALNMIHVSRQLNCRRYIFADNDASGTGQKAAQEAGIPYCMADCVGMDANDLHADKGVIEVAKKIMAAKKNS